MKRLPVVRRAYRNLRQAKLRTILTALAIAVGATTISLALAAGNGGRDFIDRQMDEMGVNILDIDVYATGWDEDKNQPVGICQAEMKDIKRIAGVDSVRGGENSEVPDQPGCYYSVVIRAKSEAEVDKVRTTLGEEMTDFVSYSQKQQREDLFRIVNIAQYGLMGFGALAILASVFGIVNTQYISVLERTREIGLMKALGMKRRDIARMFRYEAAWIGFLGGAIGVAVAWLITLLNPVINQILGIEDASIRLLRVDLLQTLVLIGSLMLVAVVSGLVPARKAAKLDPIEALRTE